MTAPTQKSERTRALLSEIALRSFRERGYDATTIRLIANEAGVSVGTTNYHFSNKNGLVQELYLEVQREHEAAARPLLADEDDLVARLAIVYRTGLAVLEPYHASAPEFLAAAVSPKASINPLSEESRPSREVVVGLFRDALVGARRRLPTDLEERLPEALLLAHLLLTLFWVYDSTPTRQRTERLLEHGLRLLRLSLPLLRVRALRAPLRGMLEVIADVRA